MSNRGKRKDRRGQKNTSSLAQHVRVGKTLKPPMLARLELTPSNWHEEFPEIIWFGLLVGNGPREQVLELIRTIAGHLGKHSSGFNGDITLSGLSAAPSETRSELISIITAAEPARVLLAPLLLFPDLPGRGSWEAGLPAIPERDAWQLLSSAVSKMLFHQTQESTDCQWALMLGRMAAGTLHVPPELAKEIAFYPHLGDQRHVRPMIRSMRLGVGASLGGAGNWSPLFWVECLKRTGCQPLPEELTGGSPKPGTTLDRLRSVRGALVQHCRSTVVTTSIDAKHDTAFGMALYVLALLEEMVQSLAGATTIWARNSLRTILECSITLDYLARKNDPALWRSHRVFGAGQAKLTRLKLDEIPKEPDSVPGEMVDRLANEDVWQEFLNIELGHWANSNLRTLAEEAGRKDAYDTFYSWTSMFTHGHWGAIRATVFDTCRNPLHRLHRIPRSTPRPMSDTVSDAAALVDQVLSTVASLFPPLAARVSI